MIPKAYTSSFAPIRYVQVRLHKIVNKLANLILGRFNLRNQLLAIILPMEVLSMDKHGGQNLE